MGKNDSRNLSTFFNGLKFGFMLQCGSIGPVCLLLFQLASVLSLSAVFMGVMGVSLADSIYIFCAAVGIAPLVKKIKKSEKIFKRISAVFLLCLGFLFISFAFKTTNIIPITQWLNQKVFSGLFIMTLLNPVTIVVFTGIFTTEVINQNLSKTSLFLFALGIVCAGFIFLLGVSVFGKIVTAFLPTYFIKGLNILVGLMLCYWGVKTFIKKR